MPPQPGAEALARGGREIALELAGEVRIVRKLGREQLSVEGDLRIREEDRELGRGQSLSGRLALGQRVVVGQELECPVEPPRLLEAADVAGVDVDHRRRLCQGSADRLRLLVVVAQHEVADLVRHLREERIPLLLGEVALRDDRVEQDLDVHLVVRAVDTGRVVDRIHVDAAAQPCVRDARALRQSEVPALADDATPEVLGVDADRVARAVAHLGMRLGLRLHEGPDAAVPEQVDGGPKEGADEIVRRHRLRLDPERGARLGRELDRLRGAREDSAAGRDELLLVVRPGRPRKCEEPRPLLEALLGIRVGVDEHVAVVEGADQLDVPGEEHAVPEHVSRHVTDAGDGEVGAPDVGSELAEVTLDRLPRTARGDAHSLVVVAGRASRGERVTEPEPVVGRERVGDVREGRGALVGGDDEVRVVAVVADDVGRRHDVAAGERVREIEHPADESPVALDNLVRQRVSVRRRPLDDEAAFCTRRDDHRVLDRLRLHQPEDLGAEVLAAVRPANPTAGDAAGAQVHSFHPRRVDEDLEHRPRRGQVRNAGGIELEREIRLPLKEVRPQHRADHAEEAAQDPVLVEALDRVELALDLPDKLVRLLLDVGCPRRREAEPEELDEQSREPRVPGERRLHIRLAEGAARLPEVLRDCP